jgi:hypothetical protein
LFFAFNDILRRRRSKRLPAICTTPYVPLSDLAFGIDGAPGVFTVDVLNESPLRQRVHFDAQAFSKPRFKPIQFSPIALGFCFAHGTKETGSVTFSAITSISFAGFDMDSSIRSNGFIPSRPHIPDPGEHCQKILRSLLESYSLNPDDGSMTPE